MVTEHAALKAREPFEQIQDFIGQAVQDGRRIDSVERDLMCYVLALDYSVLSSYAGVARTMGARSLRPASPSSEDTANDRRRPLGLEIRRLHRRALGCREAPPSALVRSRDQPPGQPGE
jgi:hypothetical protein